MFHKSTNVQKTLPGGNTYVGCVFCERPLKSSLLIPNHRLLVKIQGYIEADREGRVNLGLLCVTKRPIRLSSSYVDISSNIALTLRFSSDERLNMYTKKLSWQSSLKRRLTGLYLVAFAFVFIVAGVILLLLPSLIGTVWQTIDGALLGTGFTILVTAITARQSSLEQYRKEANLQRKTDVYGPLHAELKMLRDTFDKAHAGTAPYPRWIMISGMEPPSSLRYSNTTMLPAFSLWPAFIADYRVDNFNPYAQKLLNEVQSLAEAYGKAVEEARKAMQIILRPHIAASVAREEQLSNYQEWLRKRNSNTPEYNRWFEFIYLQMTTPSTDMPLGAGLAQSWARKIGWLLGDNPVQAAQDIYCEDAINWDAAQHASPSWFRDIFEATASELKNDQTYQRVQDAQQQLFTKLQEAEVMLYQGLLYIRNHYEGGPPPV